MDTTLKVRIGIGLSPGGASASSTAFAAVVDTCEVLGFDSLWVSERISSPIPDPLIALAVAAGRTQRLKLGTSVLVVPGRNPVLLAKEMASLDVLSGGRFLPAVGLGAVDPVEQQAFGITREERGRWFDEALALMRRCWTGDRISHHGDFFDVDGARVLPVPTQERLDVWLGGIAPSELRRVGRLGDGWLPSFCSPDDVAEARPVIDQAAADAGRTIDPQHFGALIAYADGPVPDRFVSLLERRRPGVDPRSVIPTRAGLTDLLGAFVEAGASKFVVLPLLDGDDPAGELDRLAADLLPLQN